MRIRTIVIILFVVLDAMALTSAYIQQKQKFAPVVLSKAAPEFSWQAFDGKRHTLREFSGRKVIIHFWASWCAPCREEFPKLLQAAKTLGDNVAILTIASDQEQAKAEQFIQQSEKAAGGTKAPQVYFAFDPGRTITFDLFQTLMLPETIVIDSSHQMRRKFPGIVDWNDKAFQDYVKQLP